MTSRFIRITLCLAASAALYACADAGTAPQMTAVATPAAQGWWNHESPPAGDRSLVRCEDQRPGTDSEWIGPRGGRVVVGANQLIIPAGALRTTVRITATVPNDDIAFVKFEPSGLRFRKSPLLVLDASNCGIGRHTPDVVYINDAGHILERIEARYYPQYKVVAAPIDHFSGYALAW